MMAGFLVTRSNIRDFMRWMFYLSPFSWAIRSIAINEFFDERYDDPVQIQGLPTANATTGATVPNIPSKRDAFMDVFDF